MTPKCSRQEIERRLGALEAARWNNAMEGLYVGEDDAVLLDAFARGDNDRADLNSSSWTRVHPAP